jgi:transcriptional regulator with XRE-family HTH domain
MNVAVLLMYINEYEEVAVPECETTIAVDRNRFSRHLKRAIKGKGLTYGQAAARIAARLPADSNLSHVSLWNYANGKSLPRNRDIFRAICAEFEIEPDKIEFYDSVDLATAVDLQPVEPCESATPFTLKDIGSGLAFVSFAAEIEWDKAIEIARLLRRESSKKAIAA